MQCLDTNITTTAHDTHVSSRIDISPMLQQCLHHTVMALSGSLSQRRVIVLHHHTPCHHHSCLHHTVITYIVRVLLVDIHGWCCSQHSLHFAHITCLTGGVQLQLGGVHGLRATTQRIRYAEEMGLGELFKSNSRALLETITEKMACSC